MPAKSEMEDLLADEIGATMERAKRRTQEKAEESETAVRSAAAAAEVSRNLDASPMTTAAVNPLVLVRYFST